MSEKSDTQDANELRRSAEQRLKASSPDSSALRLVHELQVHQIELEMQNEALQQARIETETALERFTELYDFAPAGYFTLDREGNIHQVNLCGAKMLGLERSKLCDRNFSHFIAVRFRSSFKDFLAKVFSEQGETSIELGLEQAGQPIRYIQLDAIPDASRQSCRMTATCITQRKQLQNEILERRKEMDTLQKKQIAVQTAAAIAHELNQPLLALTSYSEAALIMLQKSSPDLEKLRLAIEAIEKQALRAGQAIRELLEMLGTNEFHSEALDLATEIRNVLVIASAEHELHFHAECRIDEHLPPVNANRTHVQKVLLNLIHNGIEAAQEAAVDIPAIVISAHTTADGESVQLTVQDNGPGLPVVIAQRLFKSFFTTKDYGIGMGLIISKSLIEANGGRLWFDSNDGHGAAFHITLPKFR